MSKKLLFLAPMLAAAAFVIAPAAAQAANPHYYVNAKKLTKGQVTSVLGWGTITLSSNAAPPTNSLVCHNVAGGIIRGVEETKNGTGQTESFATYNCTQKLQCPKASDAAVVNPINPLTGGSSLPWPSELKESVEEPGVIRSETEGVAVIVTCIVTEGAEKGKADQNVPFVSNQEAGSVCEGQAPKTVTGTSALHPGFVEFDAASKELEVPDPELPKCSLRGKTEGEVKTLGYNAQELVNTATP